MADEGGNRGNHEDPAVLKFLNDIVSKLESSNSHIKKLCLMKERNKDGLCPVHLAVEIGNLEIIRNFIRLVPNCIKVRSSKYKTALHVAVETRRLVLVKELLPEDEKYREKFFQMVSKDYDIDGNNALHLAAKNSDTQIVKELLRWPGARVNAINKDGLTAFDISAHLAKLGCETHIRTNSSDIKEILEAVGGGRGQSDGKESKVLEVDTVVASLIATITFAAIFQIPGGIEDNKNSVQHGAARMALKFMFRCFLTSDVLAFSASITVIIAWLFRERLQAQLYKTRSAVASLSQLGLGVAIIATGISFLCATFLVIIPPNVHSLKHQKEFEAYVQIWKNVTVVVTVMPTLAFIIYVFLARKQILRLSNPEILMVQLPVRLTMFGIALFPFILLIYSNIALHK